jgi:hypothetical protein
MAYRLAGLALLLSLVLTSFHRAAGMQSLHSCPEIVQTALDLTEQRCSATGRNEACYGNALLQAQPQPGSNNFVFEESGDIVPVSDLQSLRMSAMDISHGLWGVALMRLQASIAEDEPNQNVTMLLFGDVQLQNQVSHPIPVAVTHDRAIVFSGPSLASFRIAQIPAGRTLMATGRSRDGLWLRVRLTDAYARTWISAADVRAAEGSPDLSTLTVVNGSTPDYAPMQA